MNVVELGRKLKEVYEKAPRGEQIAFIHLFGIDYSQEIQDAGIREVIDEAGIKSSLKVELNKGVNLAKYVKRR